MIKFVLRRLLLFIPVLIGVVLIVFAINRLGPGDPVAGILGSNYTQEQYDAKAAELGLDKPFMAQLGDYLVGLVTRGDLGTSFATKWPVSTEIAERFPVTLKLAVIGVIITVALGLPFGIISATRQYSLADYAVTTFSLIFAAIPGFWLGLMLIITFSLNLKWLPASGLSTWRHWILPALAVGLSPVATVTRLTRSSMLDVIRQDYIRTAKAKGLSNGTVIRKHALRNALIPIVTTVGFQLGILVSGSVIVEAIFSFPGLGTLMMSAINSKDYNVIQGCVLVLALLVCVINLIVDLLYGVIDPRIMSQYTGERSRTRSKADREEAS